jgi:hypothetical protein
MQNLIKKLTLTSGLVAILLSASSCGETQKTKPEQTVQEIKPSTRVEKVYYIERDENRRQIGNPVGCGISVPLNYSEEITIKEVKQYARSLPKNHSYEIIKEEYIEKYRGRGQSRKDHPN